MNNKQIFSGYKNKNMTKTKSEGIKTGANIVDECKKRLRELDSYLSSEGKTDPSECYADKKSIFKRGQNNTKKFLKIPFYKRTEKKQKTSARISSDSDEDSYNFRYKWQSNSSNSTSTDEFELEKDTFCNQKKSENESSTDLSSITNFSSSSGSISSDLDTDLNKVLHKKITEIELEGLLEDTILEESIKGLNLSPILNEDEVLETIYKKERFSVHVRMAILCYDNELTNDELFQMSDFLWDAIKLVTINRKKQ